MCIVSNFLKTHGYDFAKGFQDYTEDVVCTEYFVFFSHLIICSCVSYDILNFLIRVPSLE